MVDDTNIVKVPANQGFPNMTDTGIHNSVFEAFIAADKAMKELPAIREEKARLEQDFLVVSTGKADVEHELGKAEALIVCLKAALQQREAELARATFRADAVEAKHRALRGILGGDDSPSVAVDWALSQDDPTTLTASDLDHPSSPEPTPSPSSESEIGLQSAGQSEDRPTSTNKESAPVETTFNSNGGQSDPHPTANASAPTPSTTDAQSADGATDTTPADGNTTSNADGLAGSHSNSVPLYAGRLYTSKPDGMEWGYWIVNGGEAPYWYTAYDIARDKAAYAPWAGHAKAAE